MQGLDYSYRIRILVLIRIYFCPGTTTFGSAEKGVKVNFTCVVHYKEFEELLFFKDFIRIPNDDSV